MFTRSMYTVRILQFQSISSGGKCGLEGRAACSLPLAWIIRHEQCEALHVGKLETYASGSMILRTSSSFPMLVPLLGRNTVPCAAGILIKNSEPAESSKGSGSRDSLLVVF